MTAPTLPEFILARVADWEAMVRRWADIGYDPGSILSLERILAQCAAYRSIVSHATDCDESPLGGWCHSCDVALRALATIWADHPDFDEAWRP